MRPLALLRCIAKAALKHAANVVGFGLGDVAGQIWNEWDKEKEDAARQAELQALVQMAAGEFRQQVEAVVREVAAEQPAEVQERLSLCLQQVPDLLRLSFQRPDDEEGRTVPPSIQLHQASDLATLFSQPLASPPPVAGGARHHSPHCGPRLRRIDRLHRADRADVRPRQGLPAEVSAGWAPIHLAASLPGRGQPARRASARPGQFARHLRQRHQARRPAGRHRARSEICLSRDRPGARHRSAADRQGTRRFPRRDSRPRVCDTRSQDVFLVSARGPGGCAAPTGPACSSAPTAATISRRSCTIWPAKPRRRRQSAGHPRVRSR